MNKFYLKLEKKYYLGVFCSVFLLFPWPSSANTVVEVNILEKEQISAGDFLDDRFDLPDFDFTIDSNAITYKKDEVISIKELDLFKDKRGFMTINHLPKNENRKKQILPDRSAGAPANPILVNYGKSGHYAITAYNSEAAQTDASPCTTANGFNVCKHGKEDTIAANFLPFGAKVKIPDLFGDRVFIVRDRMNRRYSNRLDVWMKERSNAVKFGVKRVRIEVLDI